MKTALLILLLSVQLHAGSHERAKQFFLCHYEAAEQLYFCNGIPIELSLSVWALESGYGTSKAAQVNNLGGIKSYKGGKKHNKTFATLDNFYTSFAAIFDKPCYRNDIQPKTVKEYLRAMEYSCCSYHHSSSYASKINWIIKKYKLEQMNADQKKIVDLVKSSSTKNLRLAVDLNTSNNLGVEALYSEYYKKYESYLEIEERDHYLYFPIESAIDIKNNQKVKHIDFFHFETLDLVILFLKDTKDLFFQNFEKLQLSINAGNGIIERENDYKTLHEIQQTISKDVQIPIENITIMYWD